MQDFEYAAIRAMTDDVLYAAERYTLSDLTTVLLQAYGLSNYSESPHRLVVFPLKSKRKNPACIVIMPSNDADVKFGWKALRLHGGLAAYVYPAGAIKLAGQSSEVEVRPEAEDTALHF